MQATELKAELREKKGTGISRQLRREGKLPAVLYGKGVEATPLAVAERDVDRILRSKYGKNTLIRLEIPGKNTFNVLIKDFQGSPVSRKLMHIDFWAIREDQKIHVRIPVRITGKAAGITAGGLLEVTSREVDLICEIGRIPEEIVVDVTPLNVGQNIHLADVKLPDGVSCAPKYNPTIAAVHVVKEEVAAAPVAGDAAAAAVPAANQKSEAEKAAAAPAAKAGGDKAKK